MTGERLAGGDAATAVIAGGSSGIGAATARRLAGEGFHVHLLARREDPLRALAAEIGGDYTVVDFAAGEEADRSLAAIPDPVGLAVYAAGVLPVGTVRDTSLAEWNRALAVNMTGAFVFARALSPRLRAGGRFVFLSSVAANKGQPGQSAYAATKSGLTRFAESLGAELEPAGIGVHVVSPGPVATPMLDIPDTSPFQLEPEQVADTIASLAKLPPEVVLREVELRATINGPYARRRH